MTKELFSIEAESAVLGSIILEPSLLDKAMIRLSVDDFFLANNKTVYDAMITAGMQIKPEDEDGLDIVILRNILLKQGKLEAVGGVQGLVRIAESVPHAGNFDYYADIMQEYTIKRDMIQKTVVMQQIATGPESNTDKIEQIQELALGIEQKKELASTSKISDVMGEAYETMSMVKEGVKTGFRAIDWCLGGLGKGEVIIIAGRPSMGKTALALSMIARLAKQGLGCLIFSLEMGGRQIVQRMICSEARVNAKNARNNVLSDSQKDEIKAACNRLYNAPIYISQETMLTPDNMRASLKNIKRRNKIDCVIIDYLQLIHISSKASREQQITSISRRIKSMALEFDVPIVLLSQLSRNVEYRDNKRPRLADLRDSGMIEADADIVMFLYRDDYYKKQSDPFAIMDNKAEVIIAKNREGETGIFEVMFHPEFVSFEDMAG